MKKQRILLNNNKEDKNMEIALDFIESSKLFSSTSNNEFANPDWSEIISFSKEYPRFESIKLKKKEKAINRKSIRNFSAKPIKLSELNIALSEIANYSEDEVYSKRNYPSAGCMYTTNLYILPIRIDGLDNYVSHFYNPINHSLEKLFDFDKTDIEKIICDDNLKNYSAVLVITSLYFKHSLKYKSRGLRYSLIEIGAFAQTLNNGLTNSGIDSCWIGGFDDNLLMNMLDINNEIEVEQPFLVMIVGKK